MSFRGIQQASPVCVQSNCIYTYLLFILLPSLTICFWRAAGLLLRASNHCIEACIILIYEFLIRLNFCGCGSQAISWTNLSVAVKAFLEQPLSLSEGFFRTTTLSCNVLKFCFTYFHMFLSFGTLICFHSHFEIIGYFDVKSIYLVPMDSYRACFIYFFPTEKVQSSVIPGISFPLEKLLAISCVQN